MERKNSLYFDWGEGINMIPKVSIIVPVYNSEAFIRKCLDSLVSQTYKYIEIVIVDDGSKDNSYSICKEYGEKYSYIHIIQKENGGVSSARNCGLDYATGEYISFVDADDYVEKEYVQRLMIHANAFPDTVIKLGFFHENIQGVPVDKEEYGGEGFYSIDEIDISCKYDYSTVCAKLFPRKLIDDKNNILRFREDIHYGEDYLFCINAILRGRGLFADPSRFYHCVLHEGSAIQTFNQKRFTEIYALEGIKNLVKDIPKAKMFICRQLALKSYYIYRNGIANKEILTRAQLEYSNSIMKQYLPYMILSSEGIKLKISYLLAIYVPDLFKKTTQS